ncbi:hypothetical protein CNYM01_02660 [Colletotrichum nymphaeae SA-01]|uniref:Uncharacterized protein n=1 Tax=Colletotrichum nymphaeae SA-01 TaxID=1460502 RepID=A0A135RNT1_9PEZI|nr:hypothetical protein CNYM01_02660 [Colletotrichum nymphaeae SA-01]
MYPFSTPRLRATALSAWYRFHSYHLNRIEYYRRAMLNSMVKKRSKPKGTKTTSAHRAVSLTLFRSYGCWNGITAPCTSTHVPVLLMPVPTDDPGGDGDWSTESKSAMQEQEQPRKAKGLRTLCKTETLLKVHGSVTQDTAATGHCSSLGFSWAIPPSRRSWPNAQSEWPGVSRLFAIFLTPERFDWSKSLLGLASVAALLTGLGLSEGLTASHGAFIQGRTDTG